LWRLFRLLLLVIVVVAVVVDIQDVNRDPARGKEAIVPLPDRRLDRLPPGAAVLWGQRSIQKRCTPADLIQLRFGVGSGGGGGGRGGGRVSVVAVAIARLLGPQLALDNLFVADGRQVREQVVDKRLPILHPNVPAAKQLGGIRGVLGGSVVVADGDAVDDGLLLLLLLLLLMMMMKRPVSLR